MPSAERDQFIKGLRSDDENHQVNTLFSTLVKTDVTKAKASVKSDFIDILNIGKEVGYAEFNKTVSELLRERVIGVVIGAIIEGRHDVEDESAKKQQGELCKK